jgi:hypothetical protein
MFPLIGIGVGLALMAPAVLHLLRDAPRIQILGTPWTPLPLHAISGYPGEDTGRGVHRDFQFDAW